MMGICVLSLDTLIFPYKTKKTLTVFFVNYLEKRGEKIKKKKRKNYIKNRNYLNYLYNP